MRKHRWIFCHCCSKLQDVHWHMIHRWIYLLFKSCIMFPLDHSIAEAATAVGCKSNGFCYSCVCYTVKAFFVGHKIIFKWPCLFSLGTGRWFFVLFCGQGYLKVAHSIFVIALCRVIVCGGCLKWYSYIRYGDQDITQSISCALGVMNLRM